MTQLIIPAVLITWYVVASLILSFYYVIDKRAAGTSSRRVPERRLLTWAAVGGWPGGLLTGRSIRHKTQKVSFRVAFFVCAFLNVAVVAMMLWFFRDRLFG